LCLALAFVWSRPDERADPPREARSAKWVAFGVLFGILDSVAFATGATSTASAYAWHPLEVALTCTAVMAAMFAFGFGSFGDR
jgi:hypothetical protein